MGVVTPMDTIGSCYSRVYSNNASNTDTEMRYLAIGDIHGNLRALDQVLERSGFNPDNDTIIFLGDYVDGHPHSAEVVQRIIDIPQESRVCIAGNHDIWCREWVQTGIQKEVWVQQGGQATLHSYIANPDYLVSEEHRRFFRNLIDYYELEVDGRLYGFTHGGFRSKEGLGHDPSDVYQWDRKLWDMAMADTINKDIHAYTTNRLEKYDKFFIGHTATNYDFPDAPVPVKRGKLYNLDQGAGWEGKLTCIDVVTDEVWQSDNAIELYGKSGR